MKTVAGQLDNMVLADPHRQGRVAPIAVIDIGSNSIRLVIYASGGRYPFPLFNERSNCRLGEGLGADGMLQPERISVALAALSRFAGIMKSMGVAPILAVATAAVRRARLDCIGARQRRRGAKPEPPRSPRPRPSGGSTL